MMAMLGLQPLKPLSDLVRIRIERNKHFSSQIVVNQKMLSIHSGSLIITGIVRNHTRSPLKMNKERMLLKMNKERM